MSEEFKKLFISFYGEIKWQKFHDLSNEIEIEIGYTFKTKKNLYQALIVRAESLDRGPFEIFEFLGDAILSLIIAEFLVTTLKLKTPNDLTKLRSLLTNNSYLAEVSSSLPIKKIKEIFESELTEKHLSDTFESILGAVFFDLEFNKMKIKPIILQLIKIEKIDFTEMLLEENLKDKKSQLNEWVQKTYSGEVTVNYPFEREGPDHKPAFYVGLELKSKDNITIHEEKKIGPFPKLKDGELAIADLFMKKIP